VKEGPPEVGREVVPVTLVIAGAMYAHVAGEFPVCFPTVTAQTIPFPTPGAVLHVSTECGVVSTQAVALYFVGVAIGPYVTAVMYAMSGPRFEPVSTIFVEPAVGAVVGEREEMLGRL
jgi:hypothetical protein